MDFQAYLGIGAIVIGLLMSARELARAERSAALMSLLISLQGALLLTASVMEPGPISRAVLVGIIVVGLSISFAASRLSRRRNA